MLNGSVVLKEDDLQFVTNSSGDIPVENSPGYGLYYQDTRFLNRFDLTINGQSPLFLSNAANKHYIATFQYINPAFLLADCRKVKQQSISIRRSRFVTARGVYERIGFFNCNQFDVTLDAVLGLDADFRDMFAVRGFKTQRVAGEITVSFGGEDLTFAYRGRDDLPRATRVSFSRPPDEAISAREVRFFMNLAPHQSQSIVVRIQPCVGADVAPLPADFDAQLETVAANWRTPSALVFIDGGHGEEPARADYLGWTPHVALGATLAIIMWANVWFVIWPNQKVVIASAQQVLAGGQPLHHPARPLRRPAESLPFHRPWTRSSFAVWRSCPSVASLRRRRSSAHCAGRPSGRMSTPPAPR